MKHIARNFITDLNKSMRKNNSLACCGLDPNITSMPKEITKKKMSPEEKVLVFLETVIENTAEHVCSYKIQKAFFDIFQEGHLLLADTINYVHSNYPKIPVLIDCKIGDTDNTMKVYMDNLFGHLKADGVVVNPYMGDDVVKPFKQLTNKAGVVLVRTSNPTSDIIQTALMHDGKPLWRHVLNLLVNNWNTAGNLIPILSSTASEDITNVREVIPDKMPILLAGMGAQGGKTSIIKPLLDSSGYGVFVNSSRALLYSYNKEDMDWEKKITKAARNFKDLINSERQL